MAAVVAAAFSANALTHYYVQVNKTDGSEERFWFYDMPVAQLEDDNLKMTVVMTQEAVLYPLTEVNNLTMVYVVLHRAGVHHHERNTQDDRRGRRLRSDPL